MLTTTTAEMRPQQGQAAGPRHGDLWRPRPPPPHAGLWRLAPAFPAARKASSLRILLLQAVALLRWDQRREPTYEQTGQHAQRQTAVEEPRQFELDPSTVLRRVLNRTAP